MLEKPVVVTHKGIDVTYHEVSNTWKFSLRGRERTVSDFKSAIEAIDKPAPKKSKPFERVKAWFNRFGDMEEVEITSIVISEYGLPTVRISGADMKGLQIRPEDVFPRTEWNDKLAAQILKMAENRKDLATQMEKLRKQLDSYKVPDEGGEK